MTKIIGELVSSPLIHRHPQNPILASDDIPYDSALVYNAGVVKHGDQYIMVFRNDFGFDEQSKKAPNFQIGLAFSPDGVNWKVRDQPILFQDGEEVMGSYDPRLTVLDGRFYITYTQYTRHGYRGVIAVTDDFEHIEILHRTMPDNRDIVLFPEKINGSYWRIERPFPYFSRDKTVSFDMWVSQSPDMVYWGESELLLCVEDVPYANDRVGAGTPPIRTEHGWLSVFHAVDKDPSRGKNGWEDLWQSRYTAGVLLQDLRDPRKVIGFSKQPLLVPEAVYETSAGFRYNVIFPGGLVPEPDGSVKLYYGAADSVECLAAAQLDDLVRLCLE